MVSSVQAEGPAQPPENFAALGIVTAVVLTVAVLFSMLGRPRHRLKGRHAVITGGSEGIGLALAREMVLRGATVSLLARRQAKLDAAAEQLRAAVKDCAVHTFVADVTDYAQARGVPFSKTASVALACAPVLQKAYCHAWQVCKALAAAQHGAGPVDLLVCCAGTSVPGEACRKIDYVSHTLSGRFQLAVADSAGECCCAGLFHEQDVSVFRKTLDLNYHGTVHAVKAVLPDMMAAGAGHLVLVASAAAVCGAPPKCMF